MRFARNLRPRSHFDGEHARAVAGDADGTANALALEKVFAGIEVDLAKERAYRRARFDPARKRRREHLVKQLRGDHITPDFAGHSPEFGSPRGVLSKELFGASAYRSITATPPVTSIRPDNPPSSLVVTRFYLLVAV